METEDWIALLLVACWSFMPCLMNWIQILVLYPLVDKTIYFCNDYRTDNYPTYSSRGDDTRPDEYEEIGINHPEVDRMISSGTRDLYTVTGAQTWMKLRLMDCLIFSRRWYSILSDLSHILIPLWMWPSIWAMLLACRIVSNFFIFRERDRYPNTFVGFLVTQIVFSIIIDIIWFPLIFKIRLTGASAMMTWFYTAFFLAMYIARGTYHASVGFGFASFELVYWCYLSWFMLLISKHGRKTNKAHEDVVDVYRKAPITVFHEGVQHSSVINTPKERRQIEKSLLCNMSGEHVYPGDTVAGASLLYYNGTFPPVPIKPSRASGWVIHPSDQ